MTASPSPCAARGSGGAGRVWRVVWPVSVGKEACWRRHLGQRPCGASGGIAAPHFGQDVAAASLIPFPEGEWLRGYRDSGGLGMAGAVRKRFYLEVKAVHNAKSAIACRSPGRKRGSIYRDNWATRMNHALASWSAACDCRFELALIRFGRS